MTEFGLKNTIKVERAKRNMTQAELALKVGVSRKTINTIETGKFFPSTLPAIRSDRSFDLEIESSFELVTK